MKRLANLSADAVHVSAVIMLFCMVFVWWGTDPGATGRILIAIYGLLFCVYMVIWDSYSRKGEK